MTASHITGATLPELFQEASHALHQYNIAADPANAPEDAGNLPLQAAQALLNHYQAIARSQPQMSALDRIRVNAIIQAAGHTAATVASHEAAPPPALQTEPTPPLETDAKADLMPNDHIAIYTDGSCLGNPGPGGYAAVFVINDVRSGDVSGRDTQTTNSRMELLAVIRALGEIAPSVHDSNTITVVTDSKYVADAFNQNWLKNWQRNGWRTAKRAPVANQDLWQELLSVKENLPHIEFQWTKGHADDHFNNEADRLAQDQAQLAR